MVDISDEDPEKLFRVLDVIGQGSFGIVCTCISTSGDKMFAVKFIEISDDPNVDLQNEIDILKTTAECEFVVQYYGAYKKENYLMIVMEYCDGGSVLDVMQATNSGLTEPQIAAITYHMLKGLQYMHSHKILHRDIKAGNVLLTGDGKAKLADFGVSTKLMTTIQKHKTVVGSPYWMSPEVIVAQNGANGYDHKADIWSLGITAIEMAESKPPHYDINPLRVIFVIPNRPPPTLPRPETWSQNFQDFVVKCLAKNPSDRPSAHELLQHPFIASVADKAEGTIQALAQHIAPLLVEARKRAREREEDVGGQSIKSGTVLRMNTQSKTVLFEGADYTGTGGSYSTVQFTPSVRANSGTGSMIYKGAVQHQ